MTLLRVDAWDLGARMLPAPERREPWMEGSGVDSFGAAGLKQPQVTKLKKLGQMSIVAVNVA